MLDVLVVSPHPDDAELGMGGTILRLIEQRFAVGILDLTSGEPTPYGDPETRARETAESSRVLGVAWRHNLALPNRSLQPTLEARGQLATVFRETRPRWLFAPYWVDAHPDHVAATELTEAARFWSKLTKTDLAGEPHHPERIFYYYCVHLRMIPQPAFIVDISNYWDRKLQSLRCYESQFITGRPIAAPTFLDRQRDQAAAWGAAIGTRYGEPFASREPVGISGMREML